MLKPSLTSESVADILVDCIDAISNHRTLSAGKRPLDAESIVALLAPRTEATRQFIDKLKDCPRRQAIKALLEPDQDLVTVLAPDMIAEIVDALRNEGFALEADTIADELDRADEKQQREACGSLTRH